MHENKVNINTYLNILVLIILVLIILFFFGFIFNNLRNDIRQNGNKIDKVLSLVNDNRVNIVRTLEKQNYLDSRLTKFEVLD